MGAVSGAMIGAGIGLLGGPLGAAIGASIGAWLGNKDTDKQMAIVFTPAGVYLAEADLTIPWECVYNITLDDDDDTTNVHFVGGMWVYASDDDCATVDGAEKHYPADTSDEAWLDEDDMRKALRYPNGIEMIQQGWEWCKISAGIASQAFANGIPEKTNYNCTFATPAAIDFATGYLSLPSSIRIQVANPEDVKELLGYWRQIELALDDDACASQLEALMDELDDCASDGYEISEDEDDGMYGALEAPDDDDDEPDEDELSREETLFLKRARRYVSNDGELDDKERADLETLADKLGIDDVRMEELIEVAFSE